MRQRKTIDDMIDAHVLIARRGSLGMPTPDLGELNRYLASQVPKDLVSSAVLSPREPSDVSTGGTHVEVTITNLNRSPPLNIIYSVTVARFERDGVHLFDDIIAEAVRDLTRP